MRRWEAIFVIVALIAMPLVLLAGSMAGCAEGCCRCCCQPHAAHNSPMSRPMKTAKSVDMACQHGGLGHVLECRLKSEHGTPEYAFFAPIPPTLLSLSTKVAAPEISRHEFDRQDESATPGILTTPFLPPRS
jgi:hypothetical protein